MTEFSFTLRGIIAHAWQTLQQPAEGLRVLMALRLDRATLWTSFALGAVLSAILIQLSVLLDPGMSEIVGLERLTTLMSVVQACTFLIMVFAVYWIGQACGGVGSFDDAILAVSWLQAIALLIQVIQSALVLVVPPLAQVLAVVQIGIFFYLLTYFIATIHGFTSLGRVFMMIIASLLGLAFALTFILALVGINVPGVQNV